VRGHEVIGEASRLLTDMRVAPGESAIAAGRHVRIHVVAERSSETSMRVLVTCHALGQRDVDWQGRLLVVEGAGRERLARLDARGQAAVRGVAAESCRLDLPIVWGALPVPDLRSSRRRRWDRSGSSQDGTVSATIGCTQKGDILIGVRTHDRSLAGTAVRFRVEEGGAVGERIRGDVRLEERADEWKGRWSCRPEIGLAAEGTSDPELLFWVATAAAKKDS